jgi:hypothetical protein
MGTFTSRGNFYKSAADGSENVNVVTDLSNNWDKLDALLGWRPVTSGTMPASAFQGTGVYQTDTGRAYINQGAGGSAATSFKQVPVEGSTYAANITLASSANQFNVGSSPSSASFASQLASSGGNILSGIVSGDSSSRYTVTAAGTMSWGNGTTLDTNLYRISADLLGTDDSVQIGGNLTVSGSATLDDVIIGGNRVTNAATERPQAHTAVTVASSSAEVVLHSVTIPAGDAAVGSTYRLRVFGTAAVTGTPTITFRLRLGGLAGSLLVAFGSITARSGMTDGIWDVEAMVTLTASPGATATFHGFCRGGHNFTGSATTYTQFGPGGSSATRDSTAAQDFVLTAQWNTSSASNTITARGSGSGRVA